MANKTSTRTSATPDADKEDIQSAGDREAYLESLAKGLRCLSLFDAQRTAITIQEAATDLEITRPAARRILLTLNRLGYLQQIDREFILTPKVLELGFKYFSALGLRGAALPYMEMVAARTGETCALGVLDGEDIVFLQRAEAKKALRLDLTVGSRLPAYAHSMGRLLLAALDDEALDAYLGQLQPQAFTRFTTTDCGKLRAEIELVRKNGWSFSNGELMDGIAGISRPIVGANGKVIAGLNVSMILGSRSPEEALREMLPALTEASEAISGIQQAMH
jgi:IclR family pca regulon transcriptional regulator